MISIFVGLSAKQGSPTIITEGNNKKTSIYYNT